MEKYVRQDLLVRRDIEQVYAGLYVEIVASFERFLENLFVELLVKKVRCGQISVKPKMLFPSRDMAREIINGGRKYVDWLPYENHTEKRAKIFIFDGLPFTSLSQANKKQLDEVLLIRNAIAHKSKHALHQFNVKVISGLSLTTSERTPCGFLRSVARNSPQQTQYEVRVLVLAEIASVLCA